MRWIGVDLGTTHLKVVVYDDARREVVARAACPTPTRTDAEGTSRDAELVADGALGLVTEAVAAAPGGPPPRALAIAGVGEEVVLRGADGRALAETLAWHDPRGREEAAALRASGGLPLHARYRADPTFSLFKLLWLRRHRPDAWPAARSVVDLPAHVLARFGAPTVMDWTHASRTGMVDLAASAWDPEAVALAALPAAAALPPLVPSGTVVGGILPGVAEQLGLPRDLVLVAGGHDHLCGAFACGIRTTGDVYLSAGTSEAQLAVTDGPASAAALDQGRFVDRGHWYVHANLPAGQVYGQWLELLYAGDETAMTAEVAGVAPGSGGTRFHLGAVGEPAALTAIAPTAGRAAIMRAVIEGSALASARVTERLTPGTDGAATMVVAGHATRNRLWCELRAGLTRRTLEIVDEPESSALGAALLAQQAVTGDADTGVVARTRFEPSADAIAVADALREAYREGRPVPASLGAGEVRP